MLVGGSAGDAIDGDTGADLIFGDQVSLERRVGDTTSLRYQGLLGSALYGADGSAQLDGIAGSAGSASWMNFKILDLFHTAAIAATAVPAGKVQTYGDDYIAGGADDDMIFGQLGNDVILGDGALEDPQSGASRLPGANDPLGALILLGSVERLTDGDDYVEGGGGDDVIFGGLGQDDLIGGSSNLFTLVRSDQRPDGSDYIFGGAGTRTAANDLSSGLDDDDAIIGDNGDIVRVPGAPRDRAARRRGRGRDPRRVRQRHDLRRPRRRPHLRRRRRRRDRRRRSARTGSPAAPATTASSATTAACSARRSPRPRRSPAATT